jgi:hypothetical protein
MFDELGTAPLGDLNLARFAVRVDQQIVINDDRAVGYTAANLV